MVSFGNNVVVLDKEEYDNLHQLMVDVLEYNKKVSEHRDDLLKRIDNIMILHQQLADAYESKIRMLEMLVNSQSEFVNTYKPWWKIWT